MSGRSRVQDLGAASPLMGVRLADIHLSQTLRKAGALCTGSNTSIHIKPCIHRAGAKETIIEFGLPSQHHHLLLQLLLMQRFSAMTFESKFWCILATH
ncbi:uncharacterized protein [Malus domestica]|uniref:uncharacterized protein isoform X2 n=1 Tax=Malus domestica TaxID=3750 RepID=UPI003976F335